MEYQIRFLEHKDRPQVFEMMKTFYATDAVSSNGSDEIFNADIENCLNDSPFLEGYVFESGDLLLGYAMLAKSFSTEFGKPCIWLEDLYIQDEYRGLGVGSRFLRFMEEKYPHCLFRLEVEAENRHAVHVYEKQGYTVLPYMEMKK